MTIPKELANKVQQIETAGSALGQNIAWPGDRWLEYPGLRDVRAELRSLVDATASADGHCKISRSQVFQARAAGPVPLFLASMAWGFGTTGYGAYRTARIIDAAGLARVDEAITRLQEAAGESPEAAWLAMHKAAKLKHLGPAFATKIAYFSQGPDAHRPPLIADMNTSWGFWSLTKIEKTAYFLAGYLQYVDQSFAWADALGCRADTIEYALFELGKAARSQQSA